MGDIKLFEPQRLTDNADGGGLPTSNEILDNQVNNLFPDISRIDRVNGNVSLRKFFPKVSVDNNDLYSGLHIIERAPPADPNVSMLLFTTGSWSDERDAARNEIERFLDPSVVTTMIPYDKQLAGSRQVLVFQRQELQLPNIGEVYLLTDDSGTEDYFRITALDDTVQPFTDATGDFHARVITITINQPLESEYAGSEPNRFFSGGTNKIRKTVASNAAKYYGIAPLSAAAAIGDLAIKVGDIRGQLVPASNAETGIVDASPYNSTMVVAASSSIFAQDSGVKIFGGYGRTFHLARSIVPGSLNIVASNGSNWHCIDDGFGNLTYSGFLVATIDYRNGVVNETANDAVHHIPNVYNSVFNYTPGALVSSQSQTFAIPISQSTRGYVYTGTLHPAPSPGTMQVSYMYLGKWYTLTDEGDGTLTGDTNVGTGQIKFDTGSFVISLGALPDVGSSIIIDWGVSTEYAIRAGSSSITPPKVTGQLTGGATPSSVTVTWQQGGATKTATDDGTGAFTGDATGRIVYGTGDFSIQPTNLYDPDTTFNFGYQNATQQIETFNPTLSGTTLTFTVAAGPIRPKSLHLSVPLSASGGNDISAVLYDDGSGGLIDKYGSPLAGSSVNYSTGEITFDPDPPAYIPANDYTQFDNWLPGRTMDPTSGVYTQVLTGGLWHTSTSDSAVDYGFVNGSGIIATYVQDGATDGAQTYSINAPPLKLDLIPDYFDSAVPSGVAFTLGGSLYIDRGGTLYRNVDVTSGSASAAGTVDYTNAVASITDWTVGNSNAVTMNALLSQRLVMPDGRAYPAHAGSADQAQQLLYPGEPIERWDADLCHRRCQRQHRHVRHARVRGRDHRRCGDRIRQLSARFVADHGAESGAMV